MMRGKIISEVGREPDREGRGPSIHSGRLERRRDEAVLSGLGRDSGEAPFFAKVSSSATHSSLKLRRACELRRTGLRACELRRARWNLGGAEFGWGGELGDVREKRVAWLLRGLCFFGWAAFCRPVLFGVAAANPGGRRPAVPKGWSQSHNLVLNLNCGGNLLRSKVHG